MESMVISLSACPERELEIGVHVFVVHLKGWEKRLDFNSPRLTFADIIASWRELRSRRPLVGQERREISASKP